MNNLTNSFLVLCFFIGFSSPALLAQPRPQNAVIAPSTAPKKEVLTNASVIELAQLGLGDTVLIEKIRSSESNFDTSINGLKQLKASKVSDAVIAVMLNPSAKPATQTSSTGAPPSPSPTTTHLVDSGGQAVPLPPDKGAYLWDGKTLKLLMQSQVPSAGVNVGRAIGSVFNPFMKNKIELQLLGLHAQASFTHSQPIILVSGLGDVIPGVPSYRLLYVKQGGMRKDRRILGTYDIGGFGTIAMVENEISCEIKKIADGIYVIKPTKPLPDGEYGLVPITRLADVQANSPSIAAPPVWDFGIYAEGIK